MLSKLKKIPLKVTLSALFLIAILGTIVVAAPPLALFMIVLVLGVYSLIIVLNYWIDHQ